MSSEIIIMPYSGASDPDIPSNVPEDDKAQWVKVWNSTYKSCIADGGAEKSCETKAFKSANGAIKRSGIMERGFLKSISKFISDMQNAFTGLQERAVSISSIGNAVFDSFLAEGAWLNDLYLEDGDMFAVASQGGKLFRASVAIDDNGDIELGEMQEVITKFDPVNRTSFTSAEDGKIRMLAVSATSVINREGAIDSRDLFDSMIDYIERTGKTIPRTFFHLGAQFKTGEITDMFRDDNVLMSITEFDDSELATREIATREKEPGYWGDSIEFDPVGDPEMHDVGDGITIPVYRAGVPLAVSTVPAEMASSHYANRFAIQKQEVKRMTMEDRQKKALIDKFFDGDEEEAEGWLEDNVSVINRQIEDKGQINRDDSGESEEDETSEEEESTEELTDEATEESEAEESAEEEESENTEADLENVEEVIVEFDDSMAEGVAAAVINSDLFSEFQKTVTDAIAGVQKTVEGFSSTVEELQAASVARAKIITELQKSDEQKHQEWSEDLPRNTQSQKRVNFRPSTNGEDADAELSMEDTANETMANME